jgi:hypothetical protein
MDGVINIERISTSDLEKHLSDYRKGRAGNSKKTAEKLPQANINSALQLSNINPRFSANYSLYSSGFSYSAKARYVKNIDDVLPHINKILDQSV